MRVAFMSIEEGFPIRSKGMTLAAQDIELRDLGARRRR